MAPRQYRPPLPLVSLSPHPSRPRIARSLAGSSTTGEILRCLITFWSTWVRAKVARRSATTTATGTSRASSSTQAVGRRLQGIRDSRTDGTRTTSAPTLPPGSALLEAERLLAQLQAGRTASTSEEERNDDYR